MIEKNKYWVALIVLMWMSLTVRVLGHSESTKWALLVAGSRGYDNYRHQADVCHAYQILKNGGLKDENIIVFMYDDIAFNPENPRQGILINHPNGSDVYHGVPKDYVGDDGNERNFFAVLSGNKTAVKGGSGKVLNSGPNDTIFIYYADHGTTGLVGLPDGGILFGKDFVDALKKKHHAKSYKEMVIYMEACEAGSMFEGLLPNDINIYVTTASNAIENSYAFYCSDSPIPPPHEYTICLGDLYSISWMEDSETKDMTKETLKQQYEIVQKRTIGQQAGSHVMQYGDLKINNNFLSTYIGAKHANVNVDHESYTTPTRHISQRDGRLIYLKTKFERALNGSLNKLKAQKELEDEIAHRKHVDNTFQHISNLLFGKENGSTMMVHVRAPGQPLVDNWDCFKTLIKTYEGHCSTLSNYGRKYLRAFANMCNAGISVKQMVVSASQACPKK
ncbi:vacuolar-processing enzyme-like [Vicia villosa]|uniref:vacuolar-processing enzyme-like n=1 Tax=Vicia villosa TaxID=3911 RepID=UPI00273AF810|nr:vacuolar-processing enzyme-like [Vicia villosa]